MRPATAGSLTAASGGSALTVSPSRAREDGIEPESGGPCRTPTRSWLSGGPEVAARIQEAIVLRRLTVCRPCRPLTDADVERGLEVVEPVDRPDPARRLERP